MIYLHGSDERQQAIVDTVSKLVSDELKLTGKPRAARKGSGTQRARKPRRAS